MTGLPLTIPLLALALAPALAGDPPPPACPARDAARPPFAAPPAPPGPGLDGSWLDCYAACVDAQWPRCVAQCGGSYDPTTNPCLAICYDAIALGCAIGCTHWGVVPDTVESATP